MFIQKTDDQFFSFIYMLSSIFRKKVLSNRKNMIALNCVFLFLLSANTLKEAKGNSDFITGNNWNIKHVLLFFPGLLELQR